MKKKRAKIDQEILNRPNEIWPTNKDENGDYYYKTSICSFPGYFSENAVPILYYLRECGFSNNGKWSLATNYRLGSE